MTLQQKIETIINWANQNPKVALEAKQILSSDAVTFIWSSNEQFAFHVNGINKENEETIIFLEEIDDRPGSITYNFSSVYVACIYWLYENFKPQETKTPEGKIYSRDGMIRRVLSERRDKAAKANYKVVPGKYFYGDHILYNEKNEKFHITLWKPEQYKGYINNIDWKTNKLATTKHIIFLCDYMRKNPEKFINLPLRSPYLEITLDPLNDYSLTWKYIGVLSLDQQKVIDTLFPPDLSHIVLAQYVQKVNYIRSLENRNDVVVRPEVYDKLAQYFDDLLIKNIENENKEPDLSEIKADLFPYQKEGVSFCLYKKAAIIADEMGLGKTLQAISVALMKRKYLDFKSTLIICPSSVKYQWKKEILKYTGLEALVVEGLPELRKTQYQNNEFFFFIINYETVLRDFDAINHKKFDLIILDEAQKIKNFETKTSKAIGALYKEHGLVLTGTPIENKLIDLYGVILFLDKYKVTPLWEFSYQHCIFDKISSNKINGYYNLNSLKSKVSDLIIRRQKKDVIKQLPSVLQKDIYLRLSEEQSYIHSRLGSKLAQILAKKFKTPFDWDEILKIMTNMRRVSNSSFLIDKTTNASSKIIELEHILTQRLNIKETGKKVIIFSEWVDSLLIIEILLQKLKIGYVKLTGKVQAKKRGDLISAFQNKDDIQVFLSTEAGGSGLNLQFADTLINFEIPWNPAKKNQRIGRIDRIGQSSTKLHIFNLICLDSIEIKIASGLTLKQNLFDNVLNHDANEDVVDFSNEGKAQFIKMLEEMLEFDENGYFKSDFKPENEGVVALEEEESLLLLEETNQEPEEKINTPEFEKLEQVLTKGMEFLSGLFEMTTGEKLGGTDGHTIKVDKQTGEVTLKFKMKF